MFAFPKIEKITKEMTIVHFFMMFGYKLFSLYYPLFLIEKGFSFTQVGYNYLLIYLPMAIFAQVVGFLNHKINPAILASFGIFGYGVYALGMLFIQNTFLFYFWQVLLGISAALFFASSRAILMGFPLKNHKKSFSWFYSAPIYGDAIAPAIGAFFIYQFGFNGVFILSLIIQFANAGFCFFCLNKKTKVLIDKGFELKHSKKNYQKISKKIKQKKVFVFLLAVFFVLIFNGFYRAFFVLFLEDLGWSQDLILTFGSISSILLLPLSIFITKKVGRQKSEKNIFQGIFFIAFFSLLLGIFSKYLTFPIILFLIVGKCSGDLMMASGRSSILSHNLKKYPEEAGAIDTIFQPLGIALGAFFSGLIISVLSFNFIFIAGGSVVAMLSFPLKKILEK